MIVNEIRIENTGIQGLQSLAESLPDRTTLSSSDEIVFNFAGRDFVYLTGLVLLAAYRKSLPTGVRVRVDDTRCPSATQNLITNCGFREVVETGHENPSAQRRLGRLPLRPLSNRLNKDSAVQEITSIFEEYSGHLADPRPLTTIIGELCENALTHSEFASPSYVCARVLEGAEKRSVKIAICDSGIGFRRSYHDGTNDEVKARITRGASPIELALDGFNSSKPVATSKSILSYYGFGLYITRMLVERNRGQLLILSHGDGIQLSYMSKRNLTLNNAFPGTFVAVVLDPDNPLPLEEIYEDAVHSYVGDETPNSKVAPSSKIKSIRPHSDPMVAGKPETPDIGHLEPSVLELKHFGTELLTRETGLAVRAELATQILLRRRVIVDLDGISDITPSVADEAFAKLAEGLGLETFEMSVEFRGGTSLAKRLIDFVMKTRLKKG